MDYIGDASRTQKRYHFKNGWRLEFYMSHNRKAHITLYDNEGVPRLSKNYDYYELYKAEKDMDTLVDFAKEILDVDRAA
jgi:hypothetical protein